MPPAAQIPSNCRGASSIGHSSFNGAADTIHKRAKAPDQMFKSIAIRRQNTHAPEVPIDIGFLLECLLFYQTVEVIADHKILGQLVSVFGPKYLQELLEMRCLRIIYTEDFSAIHSRKQAGNEIHNLALFSAPHRSLQEEIRRQCVQLTGRDGKGRRLARRLEDFITPVRHEPQFQSAVAKLLDDHEFVRSAAELIVRQWAPEYPVSEPILFNCIRKEEGFMVATNLDFVSLNSSFHRRVPPSVASISPALLLSQITSSEDHLYFACRQVAELAVDSLGSELVGRRLAYLVARGAASQRSRDAFSEVLFGDARALREAFNSGAVPLDEVVGAIRASARFKKWLSDQDMSVDLIRAYYKEIAADTILERLPGKTARFALFTGAGLVVDELIGAGIGTAIGIGVGTLDTFLIDKIARGWKPNQFVEGYLKPIVERQGEQ